MPEHISGIVADVLGLEIEGAKAAGQLGYYARVLTQATLPHSRPAGSSMIRHDGTLTLRMAALGVTYPEALFQPRCIHDRGPSRRPRH